MTAVSPEPPAPMDAETLEPRRRWWRTRRPLALALWLALPPVFYPLSVGPALYFRYDGRLPKAVYAAVYDPLWAVHRALVPGNSPLTRYGHWWSELAARRHGDRVVL
jgi:hypothetical protein